METGAGWRAGCAYACRMECLDEDARLMMRYRDGDADAFAALYARHKGPLYRYLLRQVRNAGAAADLFQDVEADIVAGVHVARPWFSMLRFGASSWNGRGVRGGVPSGQIANPLSRPSTNR